MNIHANNSIADDSYDFAKKLSASLQKTRRPAYLKKLHQLKDEYFNVVCENEKAFAKERADLETEHAAIRIKNAKEFEEKVIILKKAYGF